MLYQRVGKADAAHEICAYVGRNGAAVTIDRLFERLNNALGLARSRSTREMRCRPRLLSISAEQQVRQAEVNLRRTEVRSPVNGIVTNLLLREGDYAHQGSPMFRSSIQTAIG